MRDLQHNVVSMLYSIKGLVESHLSRVEENRFGPGEDAPTHARDVMNRIYAQTERALEVTRRIGRVMRSYSETGIAPGEACIRQVWAEAIGLLRGKYDLTNFELIEHVPDGFPNVQCQPMELLEIFYCLAENAVQAMLPELAAEPKRGRFILRAYLGFSAEEKLLAHVTVADTGPGISEKILHCLFEPFMTTKGSGQGNGLGLCLVKGLVRKNGGSIAVASFRGSGTTFTLTFPIVRSGVVAADKIPSAA